MNLQLTKARKLIKAKQYQEARLLLKTIDDPAAIHLLQALDNVVPEPPVVVVRRPTQPVPDPVAQAPSAPQVAAFVPELAAETEKPLVISDATMSRFPEGKDKIQMLKAGELIKAGNFAEAQHLLEKIDHPKAREWQQRINNHAHKKGTAQAPAAAVPEDAPRATPLPNIKNKPAKYRPKGTTANTLPLIMAIGLLIAGIIALTVQDSIDAGWLQPIVALVPPLLIGAGILGSLWVFSQLYSRNN